MLTITDIPPAPFYFLNTEGKVDYIPYIKISIAYLSDFIKVLEGESATTYYSDYEKRVIKVDELTELLYKLVDVSYGK